MSAGNENTSIDQSLQMAIQHHQSGQIQQAEELYQQVLSTDPENATANHLLGVIAHTAGNNDLAIQLIQTAIKSAPNYAEAHNNLGLAFKESGQLDNAITSHRQAVALDPTSAGAHYNLGNALKESDQLDEAIACYEKAISINPEHVKAHYNLGITLEQSGQLDKAEYSYNKALQLSPDYHDARFNLSYIHLLRGEFEPGWQEYGYRFKTTENTVTFPDIPYWNGEPLKGKTLYVWTEQGLGDAIQFIRYLEKIKEKEGDVRIILSCLPALHRLLRNNPAIDKFIKVDEGSSADFHIPLMGLPEAFKTTVDSIPQAVPYIQTEAELVAQWRERLQGDSGFKVGLAWAGNPEQKKDRYRSIHVKEFSALFNIPGVSIYSLQKGHGSEQASELPEECKLIDTTEHQNGLAETAALIANLDLVISVCSCMTHLAGAIGHPVWTLLATNPDWRWLLEREDSPWYPSMRLFRQDQPGDWETVMRKVEVYLRVIVR